MCNAPPDLCSRGRNPCPCGYYGDPERDCICPPQIVSRYQRRVSGPLLDRIDLFVDVPRVDYEKLMTGKKGEPSSFVADRVARARMVQRERFTAAGRPTRLNAEMTPNHVREFVQEQLDTTASDLLRRAVQQLGLSARAFHRVLKVARTVADLSGEPAVAAAHIGEAIQYRQRVE